MLSDSLSCARVLDFSHVLGRPVCAMTLVDFGAQVAKIEPPDGELGREIRPPRVNGESQPLPVLIAINSALLLT